jgi:hypothetical protein
LLQPSSTCAKACKRSRGLDCIMVTQLGSVTSTSKGWI